MEPLARFVVRRHNAFVIVVLTAALGLVAAVLASRIEQDDNLLAFLPRDNPEVARFHAINDRFGGLDVALVGIAADDVIAPDVLARLRAATDDVARVDGVHRTLSLANVDDFSLDEEKGGIVTAPLVPALPRDDAEREALRRKVLSRDQIVGTLVSADTRALVLYAFLEPGVDPKPVVADVDRAVQRHFAGFETYQGGAPFISSYIYGTTQKDVLHLTPWAVLAVIAVLLITFRDVLGAVLALLSTGIGIVVALAAMVLTDHRMNLVIGSMPAILFAVGSAYATHVLSRFHALVTREDAETAMIHTLTGVGPTVVCAGLTTAVGQLSFAVMDIEPIRTFGLFSALGVMAAVVLALTFVPAMLVLYRYVPRSSALPHLGALAAAVCTRVQRHRRPAIAFLVVLAVTGTAFTARVDNRMDQTNFFSDDSPPARAGRFLSRHFGGSTFVNVEIEGDMSDPAVLREVERIADGLSLLDHVTGTLHIGQVVARINEAISGERRVPDTAEELAALYSMLVGTGSLDHMVTAERRHALVQLRIGTDDAARQEAVVDAVEAWLREHVPTRYVVAGAAAGGAHTEGVAARRRALVAARVLAGARAAGVVLDARAIAALERHLAQPAAAVDGATIEAALARFLRSEECVVPLDDARASAVARAVAALGPTPDETALEASVAAHVGDADETLAGDLVFALRTPLSEIWRGQTAARRATAWLDEVGAGALAGAQVERVRAVAAAALLDLEAPAVLLPAASGDEAQTLAFAVNGLPVLHRGLSRSVMSNQLTSLAFSLVLVVVIATVMFRSLSAGLLATVPTAVTLLFIYGAMGVLGVRLDIGTSMLASLVVGEGVDYAMHLMNSWYAPDGAGLEEAADNAARHGGPGILTNAITVAAGFFVLTLGEARPLQNVGGLTTAAMAVAALVTFVAVPALARRRCYSAAALATQYAEGELSPPGELELSARE